MYPYYNIVYIDYVVIAVTLRECQRGLKKN